MFSIKLFNRCILSSYRHNIYRINVQRRSVPEGDICCELLEPEHIGLIAGGYFNADNLAALAEGQREKIKIFCFRNAEQVLGYAAIALKGSKEFHYRIKKADSFLFDFTVNAPFRGKGYARLFLDMLMDRLADIGAQQLYLACKADNKIANQCYLRYGFALVKQTRFLRVLKHNLPALSV